MDHVAALLESYRWRWVIQQPEAFILSLIAAAVLTATATWIVLEVRYRGTIAKQRRTLREYENKLQGATPDEILRRMESLQARLDQLEPRRLSNQQKTVLKEYLPLPEAAGITKINIVFDARCSDGKQYAADYVRALRSCRGWRASSATLFGWARELTSGIAIVCYRHGRTAAAGKVLSNALAEAGIDHETLVSPEEELELIITSRHSAPEQFDND